MDRFREKMEEAIQQRKKFQESTRFATESSPTDHKTRYIFALGGIAAGVAIAVLVWWAKSVGSTDEINMISLESAEAIQASEIKKSRNNITQLNERLVLLTGTIEKLEAKLMRVLIIADSNNAIDSKLVTAAQHDKSGIIETESVFETMEPPASGIAHTTHETEEEFTPTHTVKTKINLRPAASLSTTPITVLKVGTQVEYISEIDDWYYVNTKSSGTGWCSSSYLSALKH